MATYTVTTGNDVTQYTVSTGARGPTGPSGVGTTEEVLGLLQGDAGDSTRIGTEYMPPLMEFDYIRPGVVTTEAKPAGSLTRIGDKPRFHDGTFVGGFDFANTPAAVRISGFRYALPFGAAGSSVKQASSMYWGCLGFLTVPGYYMRHGTMMTVEASIHYKGSAGLNSLQRHMLLAPLVGWTSTDYWGSQPAYSNYASITPTNIRWRLGAGLSTESQSYLLRTHQISIVNNILTILDAPAGTYQYGFDYAPGNASWTDTTVAGQASAIPHTPGTDYSFALLYQHNTTDTRQIWYDVQLSFTLPS